MKKILSMVFCLSLLLAFVPSVSAADDLALTVTYKENGSKKSDEWTVFHDGWTDAIQKSMDEKYSNVKVTLERDWDAVDGQFTPDFWNKDGFNWDAIEFPSGCNITVDLNGFTIDRGLTEDEKNGEVMYINDDANVTIETGIITGGFSNNGAGGIHMSGGNLTLKDVNIVENFTDFDQGGGMAVYGGTLLMEGGCISFNGSNGTYEFPDLGGGLYVDGGDVTLRKVEFKENNTTNGDKPRVHGGAIAIDSGKLTMEKCVIEDNFSDARGVLYLNGGKSEITDCDFIGNESETAVNVAVYGGDSTFKNCNFYCSADRTSICGNGGMAVFDSCYIEGYIYDGFIQNTEFRNNLTSPVPRTGSLVGDGSPMMIIAAAGLLTAAGAAGIVLRRKAAAQ